MNDNEASTVGQLIELLSTFPADRKIVYGWSDEAGDRRIKVTADSDGAVCLDAGSLMPSDEPNQ